MLGLSVSDISPIQHSFSIISASASSLVLLNFLSYMFSIKSGYIYESGVKTCWFIITTVSIDSPSVFFLK